MVSATSALNQWLSLFGWPVYGRDDVPANAQLPFITAPVTVPEWDKKTSYQIQLWARSTEYAGLIRKADDICAAVGAGLRIPFPGGLVVLWPDTPLQQLIPDGDCRRVLIMLQANVYSVPGM